MRIGRICHAVLDFLVRSGNLVAADWDRDLEAAWSDEVRREGESVGEAPGHLSSEPERWPGYELKRARLRRMAARLRTVLTALPEGAVLLPEEPMAALEGKLRGRPDLVVRHPDAHMVIDYKSGRAVEKVTLALRTAYEHQLQLYAFLEAETSGSWPTSAHLYPLEGSPVEIAVDPRECTALAEEAVSLLGRYNATCPEPQPATAGLGTCPRCQYATNCPAFWDACDSSWSVSLQAVAGQVLEASSARLGGISLLIQAEAGSLGSGQVWIRNIAVEEHPVARSIQRGSVVGMVGLREEEGRGFYRLPEWGLIRLIG